MSDVVLTEIDNGVATVTLNRPESLNSLSLALKLGLIETLTNLASTDGIRALVLTGSGRGFCVGQDLAEHVEQLASGEALNTVEEHYNPLLRVIADLPFPVIAAINGTAAGAGLSLALACDLRIGAEGAKYTTAFTGIGLTMDGGMSWTLQRIVGLTKAQELVYLGQPFTTEQANDWGMLTALVPADQVLSTAQALARQLCNAPTVALVQSRRAMAFGASSTFSEALDFEAVAQVKAGATSDHHNAVASFLKKERPVFEGR